MIGTTNISGGASTGSDDCTGTPDKWLEGTSAIGKGTNDEPANGTMKNKDIIDPVIGGINSSYPSVPIHKGRNAQISTTTVSGERLLSIQPLNGGFYANSYIGVPQTEAASAGGLTAAKMPADQAAFGIQGSIPVLGAGTKGISCGVNGNGVYYYIPQGRYYPDGSNNSWVYMTPQEVINAMGIQSIVNFNSALYSSRAILLTWNNPSRGLFSGVRIMYGTNDYPASPNDGTLAYEGSATSTILTNLISNAAYYFHAFPYINTNQGRFYYTALVWGQTAQYCVANEIKGQQVFTSSGMFAVPNNVRTIQVFCVGGGASGDWRSIPSGSTYGGGGGGGGGYTNIFTIGVSPGQSFPVTIGMGSNANTSRGGSTSFSDYTVNGGAATYVASLNDSLSGGNGGSGGGSGAQGSGSQPPAGGDDGNDGGSWGRHAGGIGQHISTKSFDGVLYAGGGGGGGPHNRWGPSSLGGGGAGGDGTYSGVSGTANTGGGGGGGGSGGGSPGRGGSGICIIRWGY